jgi:hypothetical protein
VRAAAFDARSGIGTVLGESTYERLAPHRDRRQADRSQLVENLQDTIEALKREIVRNPKSDEYRKALKGTGERLTIAKQILAREEARASHSR